MHRHITVLQQQLHLRIRPRLRQRARRTRPQNLLRKIIDRGPRHPGILHVIQPIPPIQRLALAALRQPPQLPGRRHPRRHHLRRQPRHQRPGTPQQRPRRLTPPADPIRPRDQPHHDLVHNRRRRIRQLLLQQPGPERLQPPRPHLIHQQRRPLRQLHRRYHPVRRDMHTHPKTRRDQIRRLRMQRDPPHEIRPELLLRELRPHRVIINPRDRDQDVVDQSIQPVPQHLHIGHQRHQPCHLQRHPGRDGSDRVQGGGDGEWRFHTETLFEHMYYYKVGPTPFERFPARAGPLTGRALRARPTVPAACTPRHFVRQGVRRDRAQGTPDACARAAAWSRLRSRPRSRPSARARRPCKSC